MNIDWGTVISTILKILEGLKTQKEDHTDHSLEAIHHLENAVKCLHAHEENKNK